jgi:hypothetical protein
MKDVMVGCRLLGSNCNNKQANESNETPISTGKAKIFLTTTTPNSNHSQSTQLLLHHGITINLRLYYRRESRGRASNYLLVSLISEEKDDGVEATVVLFAASAEHK